MKNGFLKGLLTGLCISAATVLIFTVCGLFGMKGENNDGKNLALGTASPVPTAVLANNTPVVTGTAANHDTESKTDTKDNSVKPTAAGPVASITESVTPTVLPVATLTPTPIPDSDKFTADSLYDESFLAKYRLLGTALAEYYYKDLSESEIMEEAYRNLLESVGDPYTCYYSPEEYSSLMQSTSGTYSGIGAYVSQNIESMVITITEPFENGPAYAAGIRQGDIIKTVSGIDVSKTELSEVVAMMKGEDGTEVVITVYRTLTGETLEFTVTRGKVEVPTVTYEILDGNLGYIKVVEFDEVTEQQFKDAVDDLTQNNVKGLIIDFRNNGGGVFGVTIEMADYILPQGDLITYTLDKTGYSKKYFSDDKHSVDLPIVIIVNEYSASASEVFTGALKDNGAATVIGTTTFGKGIVQSVFPITDGSAVKVTTSSYYTPSGICIHGIGINPDVTVDYIKDDNQLDAAVEYLIGK